MMNVLTFNTLCANSADVSLMIYLTYFCQKTGFDISCNVSLLETICTKCPIQFSEKKIRKIFQNVDC